MKSRKKIWELQHQTVCKIMGMAFDLQDLKKLARKFGIEPGDVLMDHEFALHSTAVQLCSTDNKVSRHIQKLVQMRFHRYSRRLAGMEVGQLIGLVTESKGSPDIPLWAILWDLATRGSEGGASVETALFGFIHMLEHRLIREFWRSAAARDEERAEQADAAREMTRLKRQILDLTNDLARSEKVNDYLRMQIAELKTTQERRPEPRGFAVIDGLQRMDQTEKILRLQMLLEQSRSRSQDLEQECSRLNAEVQILVRELSLPACEASRELSETGTPACPCLDYLRQKHVAMVGGINSLETHYRDLVEARGGTFQRHDGDCSGGECLIHDCVRKADLVVCPVEVNSHNAVKSVKKLCKRYGVACCFPRTAGLSGFKVAIEEHFTQASVA